MADDKSKLMGDDPFGLRTTAEMTKALAEAGIVEVHAFLERICYPAAVELGLLAADTVKHWRMKNAANVFRQGQEKLQAAGAPEDVKADLRIGCAILEKSSWIDDETLQDLWAGLLSESCSEDGSDDSNLVFVDLLDGLTKGQARILGYACKKVTVHAKLAGTEETGTGYLIASESYFAAPVEEWLGAAGHSSIERLDCEFDDLRRRELIEGGFFIDRGSVHNGRPRVAPTPLALTLIARCSGKRVSPYEYYGLSDEPNAAEPSRDGKPLGD